MSYIFLGLAVISEVAGTTLLKFSQGFTKLVPSIFAILCYLVTLYAMSMAYKEFNIGFVYAVWSGLGIILTTTVGILFFKEPVIWQKFIFISLIISGVIGLNIITKA